MATTILTFEEKAASFGAFLEKLDIKGIEYTAEDVAVGEKSTYVPDLDLMVKISVPYFGKDWNSHEGKLEMYPRYKENPMFCIRINEKGDENYLIDALTCTYA